MTSSAVEDKILGYGYITKVGIDEILAADIIDSTESFSDSDDLLMTAKAINDRIESFGYGTGTMSSWTLTGDSGTQTITNGNTVDIAGGTGITTAASATDTVTVNLSAGTNDLSDVTINSGTLANGQILQYSSGESAFINATNQAITMSGSTTNGVLTRNSSTEATVESSLTFDGTSLNLADDKILSLGNSNDLQIQHSSPHNYIDLNNGNIYFRDDADNNIFIVYREGGGVQLSEGDLKIPATSKLYLDGGGDTYIHETSGNNVEIVVGGTNLLDIVEGGTDYVRVRDDVLLGAGSSLDMYMLHTGGHSYIYNGTGNLNIVQQVDDGDLILMSDDGSGGNTAYLTLDGSEKFVRVPDDGIRLTVGAGNDLQLLHNGTNSYIANYVGDLVIENHEADKDIIFYNDDGSGGTAAYLTLDGSATLVNFDKASRHMDNTKLYLGGGLDLELYHTGSDSYIANTTGDLYIQNEVDDKDIIFRTDDGSGGVTPYITLDGSDTRINIDKKMTFPASHTTDKIVMYRGGNEKIGTEANTLLFTADNFKYKDVGGAVNFELDSSGIPSFEQGAIIGGFGARTTGGTTDWNDSTNARSGNGHTLLLSTATNGPGADVVNTTNTTYIHPFSFEYSSYDNDGNMTQIGIPYYFANNDGVRPCIRSRYSGTWSNWHSLITGNNAGQIQGSGTAGASAPAYSFNGDGTNDLDTGMYRSATNQIGFATNGVQRMTIGNTALKVDDIHSLSNDNNRLILDDDTNSSQGNGVSLTGANHIYLCPDETNNGTGEVRVIKGTDNDLDSGTATELFRITNAGKVGITEDSIDANLHITGSPVVIKMERAGHRAMRMGTPSNSSLFVFADSDNLQSNQRMVIDNSGLVGIGTTSPYERLYVQCEDATSPAIVSNPSQTNGAIAYAIGYGDANRDYLNTWGMSYSAGANVFGYGVKPSTSSDEAFINSADNSNFKRGALYFDDELKFFNASAITGTIDTAITMTERFRVDADGDGFFDRDVVAFQPQYQIKD